MGKNTLTVGELIEKLQKHPSDMLVVWYGSDDDHPQEITTVDANAFVEEEDIEYFNSDSAVFII